MLNNVILTRENGVEAKRLVQELIRIKSINLSENQKHESACLTTEKIKEKRKEKTKTSVN